MRLMPQALTDAAFAPFGRVLHAPDSQAPTEWINGGTAQRFELLSDALLSGAGGRPVLAISRAAARALPMDLQVMERHALGSQSFAPLGGARRFVVVVAPPGPPPQPADLRAFVTDGRQGVWLAPGTWHHALLALDAGDFLVVERRADAPDCEEAALDLPVLLLPPR